MDPTKNLEDGYDGIEKSNEPQMNETKSEHHFSEQTNVYSNVSSFEPSSTSSQI